MNESKKREILGIVFAVFAVVGLIKKMGISVPLLTPLISVILNVGFSLLSKTVQTYSGFVPYMRLMKEPLLWCLSASWLGVGIWLWCSRHEESEKVRKIPLSYYPLMVPVFAATAFALGYAWDPSFKVQFYSATFSLSLIFGFLVGRFWSAAQMSLRKDL